MSSKWISITSHDDKTFEGYLSLPPTGHGPAILLIQEIFGVNEHIRSVADQYASAGFVVLAPDVFWRQQKRVELGYDKSGMDQGIAMMQKLDPSEAIKDLTSTAALLRSLPEVTGKIASVGYCLGGRLSYACAAKAGVDAAVCYYPGGVHTQLELVSEIHVPILFHFGAKDDHLPMEAVDAVKKAFAGHHDATVDVYEGADHGFNCWARGSYHQPAAALALGRSLEFLAETICV
jgi:carboxymethylenebutenolidase